MRKINDRLTVYTCEEIRQIVSDLIGEDAFKDFDTFKYDKEPPLMIFAQYKPKENMLYAIYRLNSDKTKILPRYELREISLSNGEWTGTRYHRTSFDRVDLCDEFIKDCERFIKSKGNEAFIYISEFVLNNSSIYNRCEGTFI